MKKILIVDDDVEFAMSMKRILEQYYSVIVAHNAKDALNYAVTEKPDLIILDVMMEELTTGFHLAYEFRNQIGVKVPIIMLTMIGEVKKMKFDLEKDSEFLPVNEFIEKPVDYNLLLEKIKKYI
ncbi:MAG: response regulator [bacterium]|nr:response regulator [bacterium]